MALADIPGLGAYIQRRQMNEQAPLAELQQVGAVQGLLAKMQAQAKQQKYEEAIASLGPQATEDDLARVVSQFNPEKGLDIRQRAADKKATLDLQRETKEAALKQDARQADMLHEFRLSQAKTAGERAAETARHNKVLEGFQSEMVSLRRDAAANRPQEPLVGIIGDDGKPTLVPRSQAVNRTPATAEKPMNEFQGKSTLYGTRAAQSDKILKSLEDKISVTGLAAKRGAQSIPVIGGLLGAAGNVALSSEQQRVEQAQRDFVNAVLRQESGAVISDAEFENAQKQYFPVPGDNPQVIAQKRANRQMAIRGFARMAGSGGADIDAVAKEPLLPGGAAPAAGALSPEEQKELDALRARFGRK